MSTSNAQEVRGLAATLARSPFPAHRAEPGTQPRAVSQPRGQQTLHPQLLGADVRAGHTQSPRLRPAPAVAASVGRVGLGPESCSRAGQGSCQASAATAASPASRLPPCRPALHTALGGLPPPCCPQTHAPLGPQPRDDRVLPPCWRPASRRPQRHPVWVGGGEGEPLAWPLTRTIRGSRHMCSAVPAQPAHSRCSAEARGLGSHSRSLANGFQGSRQLHATVGGCPGLWGRVG